MPPPSAEAVVILAVHVDRFRPAAAPTLAPPPVPPVSPGATVVHRVVRVRAIGGGGGEGGRARSRAGPVVRGRVSIARVGRPRKPVTAAVAATVTAAVSDILLMVVVVAMASSVVQYLLGLRALAARSSDSTLK